MYAAYPNSETPMEMTEADYLALDESSPVRHEYRQGKVYAMTGGSVRHSVITVNISTQFNIQVGESGYSVASPDLRVHIAQKNSYRHPDVTVFCGAPAYLQGRTDTITNPIVLVEVLSPSSALLDRNEKLEEYTQIETLQTYLLIAQDKMKIERFLRHESGQWLYQYVTGLEAQISVPALDCTLALSQIYKNVDWEQNEA